MTQNKFLRKVLDVAEQKLGIEKPSDWYSVSLTDLYEISSFPRKLTRVQLAELLAQRYPNQQWDKVYLLKGRYAQQSRLEKVVKTLFADFEINYNARKEPDIINPVTRSFLELDIFIPSLSLGFEFQEAHHYTSTAYSYEPVQSVESRDDIKREIAKSKGITLITVPFWWDGKPESLVATIHKELPNLLHGTAYASIKTAQPIPSEPPTGFLEQKQTPEIEGIGRPVTACFLARKSVNPKGWWVFEKYDGIRGFWNPVTKCMYSRLGNKLPIPQYILAEMPQDTFLDGELWFGRDNFQEALKLSNRAESERINWSSFKFMVFDIPTQQTRYAERYKQLAELFAISGPWKYLALAPKDECTDESHLETLFQDLLDQGAEGIILRDPSSPYMPGRSAGYLKHKKFRDAEARVIGTAGRHQWECELPNGIRFLAAASSIEFVKRWNLKPGDVVSFKHHGFLFSSKKPKLPTIYRIRTDMTWQQVVNNWKEQTTARNVRPLRRKKILPKGHWHDPANRRKFFEDLANEQGFQVSDVARWDSVSATRVRVKKGGASLLKMYDGSLKQALRDSFPELDLKANRNMPKYYWQNRKNRQIFFEEFANERGFRVTDVSRWNTVGPTEIAKAGGSMLVLYNGSLQQALRDTFPELDFTGANVAHLA